MLVCVMGGDENLMKDMNVFISNIDFICEWIGVYVMFIYYSGKENKNCVCGLLVFCVVVDMEIKIEGSKIFSMK